MTRLVRKTKSPVVDGVSVVSDTLVEKVDQIILDIRSSLRRNMAKELKWQPIDTVPDEIKSSGEDVLLGYMDELYGQMCSVGFWAPNHGYPYWKCNLIGKPTHWMPILELPKVEE